MNTRVRYQGLSSQEMLFKRNMVNHEELDVKDKTLSDKQVNN